MPRRSGLTLLELVVVLAILAVLTGLAVGLTDAAVDQARFDGTQRQLTALGDAVLGTPGEPDSPSFVADIGRPPLAVAEVPPDPANPGALVPAELWQQSGLRPFGPVAVADPEIRLFSGWRGPYLTPPGNGYFRDGWGVPYSLLLADGLTAVPPGGPVAGVRSVSGPYAAKPELLTPFVGDALAGVVQGSVRVFSTTPPSSGWGTTAAARLYKPDGGNVATGVATADATMTFQEVVAPAAPTPGQYVASFAFAGVPAGPVAVRVYEDGATMTGRRTAVSYLRVRPRGTVVLPELRLTLP